MLPTTIAVQARSPRLGRGTLVDAIVHLPTRQVPGKYEPTEHSDLDIPAFLRPALRS
jgi:hypothetical protein